MHRPTTAKAPGRFFKCSLDNGLVFWIRRRAAERGLTSGLTVCPLRDLQQHLAFSLADRRVDFERCQIPYQKTCHSWEDRMRNGSDQVYGLRLKMERPLHTADARLWKLNWKFII